MSRRYAEGTSVDTTLLRRKKHAQIARVRRTAARRKRYENIQREIVANKYLSVDECSWAAGHFEGEGTISLSSQGKIGQPRCVISLASTDIEVIQFFQERWPGYFGKTKSKPQHKQAYVWRTNTQSNVLKFIKDIEFHLRTTRVRTKAALMVEELEDRLQHTERDPERTKRSMIRAAKMRVLNQRGVPEHLRKKP